MFSSSSNGASWSSGQHLNTSDLLAKMSCCSHRRWRRMVVIVLHVYPAHKAAAAPLKTLRIFFFLDLPLNCESYVGPFEFVVTLLFAPSLNTQQQQPPRHTMTLKIPLPIITRSCAKQRSNSYQPQHTLKIKLCGKHYDYSIDLMKQRLLLLQFENP